MDCTVTTRIIPPDAPDEFVAEARNLTDARDAHVTIRDSPGPWLSIFVGNFYGTTTLADVTYVDDIAGAHEAAICAKRIAEAFQTLADFYDSLVAATPRNVYTAEFTPQAWLKDYAISVDPQGDTVWDCTDYFYQLPASQQAQINRDIDEDGHQALDRDDSMMYDPAAPEWVQRWPGPFDIHITREVQR